MTLLPTSKNVLAIDPGNTRSAFVLWNGIEVSDKGLIPNEQLLDKLESLRVYSNVLACEMVACYGMPVGREVFDTCVWIGRYCQAWEHLDGEYHFVYRSQVKKHLLGKVIGKDSHISRALKDRFGPPGTKSNPNPITYGMKYDIWQAFAIAVYQVDTNYA